MLCRLCHLELDRKQHLNVFKHVGLAIIFATYRYNNFNFDHQKKSEHPPNKHDRA
jgi:hypothetical protein